MGKLGGEGFRRGRSANGVFQREDGSKDRGARGRLHSQRPPANRLRAHWPRGTRGGRRRQIHQQQRQGEGDRRPLSCRLTTGTCASTRFGVCLGDEVRDSQDSGCSCSICPRILRLERLVKKQQRKGSGGGQARGVHAGAAVNMTTHTMPPRVS